ncbi:sulfotransferase family 2 domain-containing protein [Magnetospirillum moscoviense]|nr:sulfotransferase family 2 domain-containing protein [Magnetospirillum moscoviense]
MSDAVMDLVGEAGSALKSGDHRQAAAILDPLLALVPNHADANALGGIVSLLHGRASEAAQRLALAFDGLETLSGQVVLSYAAALAALDLTPKADEILAAYPYPQAAKSLLDVADNLVREGRRIEALGILRFIAGLDDPWLDDPAHAFALAVRLVALSDSDAARLVVDRYLAGPDRRFEALAIRAGIDVLAGELDTAAAAMEQLRRHRSDLAEDPRLPAKLHQLHEGWGSEGRDGGANSFGTDHFVALPRSDLLIGRGEEATGWRAARQIVVYHVSESGGTSLVGALDKLNGGRYRACVTRAEADQFAALDDAQRHDISLVHWHLPLPIRPLVSSSARIVSMVRDPVQRVVSHYYWQARHRGQGVPWVSDQIEAGMSLRDWVDWLADREVDALSNWITALEPPRADPQSAAGLLEAADRHIDFLGITEFFDESLFILAALLGADRVPKWERAATGGPPKLSDLDPAIIRRIETITEADREFFHACRSRFLERYGDMVEFHQRHIGSLEMRRA